MCGDQSSSFMRPYRFCVKNLKHMFQSNLFLIILDPETILLYMPPPFDDLRIECDK